MPFDELFWRKSTVQDIGHTYEPDKNAKNALAESQEPDGIQGFITALPINWTAWENNLSGFNLTVIAMENTMPKPTMVGAMDAEGSSVAANTTSTTENQTV
jgi:phospholipase D1/2